MRLGGMLPLDERGGRWFRLCSCGNREAGMTAMDDNQTSDKRKGVKVTRGRKPRLTVAASNDGVVVSLARGQGKNEWGLTSKQEEFCQGVGTRGETLSVSYRTAYDAANMAPATVHNEACKLMARPEIAARINDLVRAKQARGQHDAARIRAHVIERLHAESTDPDNPPAARVRALELLGKLDVVGAFRERVATEPDAPAQADLAATLEARLKALLAKAG